MKIGVYKVNRCPYVDLCNRINNVNTIVRGWREPNKLGGLGKRWIILIHSYSLCPIFKEARKFPMFNPLKLM